MSPDKLYPVPMFGSTTETKKLNINQQIRDAIKDAIEDEDLFKLVLDHLMPEGLAGNRLMDMALACRAVLDATGLKEKYEHMNESLCSKHLIFVLRGRGYVIDKGRLTGHIGIEHQPDEESDIVSESEEQPPLQSQA